MVLKHLLVHYVIIMMMIVYKIIGVFLHNDITTNQLHIDEFNKLFYV
jgi:hypothetical protein